MAKVQARDGSLDPELVLSEARQAFGQGEFERCASALRTVLTTGTMPAGLVTRMRELQQRAEGEMLREADIRSALEAAAAAWLAGDSPKLLAELARIPVDYPKTDILQRRRELADGLERLRTARGQIVAARSLLEHGEAFAAERELARVPAGGPLPVSTAADLRRTALDVQSAVSSQRTEQLDSVRRALASAQLHFAQERVDACEQTLAEAVFSRANLDADVLEAARALRARCKRARDATRNLEALQTAGGQQQHDLVLSSLSTLDLTDLPLGLSDRAAALRAESQAHVDRLRVQRSADVRRCLGQVEAALDAGEIQSAAVLLRQAVAAAQAEPELAGAIVHLQSQLAAQPAVLQALEEAEQLVHTAPVRAAALLAGLPGTLYTWSARRRLTLLETLRGFQAEQENQRNQRVSQCLMQVPEELASGDLDAARTLLDQAQPDLLDGTEPAIRHAALSAELERGLFWRGRLSQFQQALERGEWQTVVTRVTENLDKREAPAYWARAMAALRDEAVRRIEDRRARLHTQLGLLAAQVESRGRRMRNLDQRLASACGDPNATAEHRRRAAQIQQYFDRLPVESPTSASRTVWIALPIALVVIALGAWYAATWLPQSAAPQVAMSLSQSPPTETSPLSPAPLELPPQMAIKVDRQQYSTGDEMASRAIHSILSNLSETGSAAASSPATEPGAAPDFSSAAATYAIALMQYLPQGMNVRVSPPNAIGECAVEAVWADAVLLPFEGVYFESASGALTPEPSMVASWFEDQRAVVDRLNEKSIPAEGLPVEWGELRLAGIPEIKDVSDPQTRIAARIAVHPLGRDPFLLDASLIETDGKLDLAPETCAAIEAHMRESSAPTSPEPPVAAAGPVTQSPDPSTLPIEWPTAEQETAEPMPTPGEISHSSEDASAVPAVSRGATDAVNAVVDAGPSDTAETTQPAQQPIEPGPEGPLDVLLAPLASSAECSVGSLAGALVEVSRSKVNAWEAATLGISTSLTSADPREPAILSLSRSLQRFLSRLDNRITPTHFIEYVATARDLYALGWVIRTGGDDEILGIDRALVWRIGPIDEWSRLADAPALDEDIGERLLGPLLGQSNLPVSGRGCIGLVLAPAGPLWNLAWGEVPFAERVAAGVRGASSPTTCRRVADLVAIQRNGGGLGQPAGALWCLPGLGLRFRGDFRRAPRLGLSSALMDALAFERAGRVWLAGVRGSGCAEEYVAEPARIPTAFWLRQHERSATGCRSLILLADND